MRVAPAALGAVPARYELITPVRATSLGSTQRCEHATPLRTGDTAESRRTANPPEGQLTMTVRRLAAPGTGVPSLSDTSSHVMWRSTR